MSKWRKKPVVIEATKFSGDNQQEIRDFIGFDCEEMDISSGIDEQGFASEIKIFTLEGTMTASLGDWIIKSVKNEFYPCKPNIFEATYEKVEDV